jgi:hypothetical protein
VPAFFVGSWITVAVSPKARSAPTSVSSTLAGTFTVDEGEGEVVTVGSSAASSVSPPQDARTRAAATVRAAVRVVRVLERFTRTW